jgi:DNA-binding response OmpR family regulator
MSVAGQTKNRGWFIVLPSSKAIEGRSGIRRVNQVRRILCVDGYKDTCDLLQTSLTQLGYEAITARTLEQALNLATTEKFDLYIIEKTYVDGTGLALCKLLRAYDPGSEVIFFSGDPHEPSRKEALEAGAYARLVNQGSAEELAVIIRRLSSLPPFRALA